MGVGVGGGQGEGRQTEVGEFVTISPAGNWFGRAMGWRFRTVVGMRRFLCGRPRRGRVAPDAPYHLRRSPASTSLPSPDPSLAASASRASSPAFSSLDALGVDTHREGTCASAATDAGSPAATDAGGEEISGVVEKRRRVHFGPSVVWCERVYVYCPRRVSTRGFRAMKRSEENQKLKEYLRLRKARKRRKMQRRSTVDSVATFSREAAKAVLLARASSFSGSFNVAMAAAAAAPHCSAHAREQDPTDQRATIQLPMRHPSAHLADTGIGPLRQGGAEGEVARLMASNGVHGVNGVNGNDADGVGQRRDEDGRRIVLREDPRKTWRGGGDPPISSVTLRTKLNGGGLQQGSLQQGVQQPRPEVSTDVSSDVSSDAASDVASDLASPSIHVSSSAVT